MRTTATVNVPPGVELRDGALHINLLDPSHAKFANDLTLRFKNIHAKIEQKRVKAIKHASFIDTVAREPWKTFYQELDALGYPHFTSTAEFRNLVNTDAHLGNITIAEHGLQRMKERGIAPEDILKAITRGSVNVGEGKGRLVFDRYPLVVVLQYVGERSWDLITVYSRTEP